MTDLHEDPNSTRFVNPCYHDLSLANFFQEIIKRLEVPGKHLTTFFVKFQKQCNPHRDTLSFEPHTSEPIQMADLVDLEKSDVIPPNSAADFFKLCSGLNDLFPVTGKRCHRYGGRHTGYFLKDSRYRTAVFVAMVYHHLYDKQLDSSRLEPAGIQTLKVAR